MIDSEGKTLLGGETVEVTVCECVCFSSVNDTKLFSYIVTQSQKVCFRCADDGLFVAVDVALFGDHKEFDLVQAFSDSSPVLDE